MDISVPNEDEQVDCDGGDKILRRSLILRSGKEAVENAQVSSTTMSAFSL